MRSRMKALAGALLLAALPCPALACTWCLGVQQRPTLRQEAIRPGARLVLHGTLSNARLTGDGPGKGLTDFAVGAVIKLDPALPREKQFRRGDRLVLPHYLPATDAVNPLHYLLFCDVSRGRLDVYRGLEATGRVVDYLKEALALDAKDSRRCLLYFFRHLDDPDREVAADAFMEFAKATDQQVSDVAGLLPPAKLRAWLKGPDTPRERLGLYAFLLGCCGNKDDVAWFEAALARATKADGPAEFRGAVDGILAGYIRLRPQEGWERAARVLADGRAALPVRISATRTLRFYHAWKPNESRAPALRALGGMLAQGDLADMAVEELRQWRAWDLTDSVLALYGRPGFEAPIARRAVVRYALCCPLPRAKAFVAEVRKSDPRTVEQIEDVLQNERE